MADDVADGEGTTALPTGDQVRVLLDGRGRVARRTLSPAAGSERGRDAVEYGYNGLDDVMQAVETGVDGARTTTYVHDGRGVESQAPS